MAGAHTRRTDGVGWIPILIRAVPGLLVVAAVSQEFAGESLPGACDENISSGTKHEAGCDFLEGGGYTAIRVVPSLIVIGFTLAAHSVRRVGVVYLGLAVACLLLILSIAIEVTEYPWVDGTDR